MEKKVTWGGIDIFYARVYGLSLRKSKAGVSRQALEAENKAELWSNAAYLLVQLLFLHRSREGTTQSGLDPLTSIFN